MRSSPSITIHRAQAKDAEQLTAIAHAAKGHWGYPERWMRLWREALTVKPKFIGKHPVFCAVRGRRIVGFYALSHRGAQYELDHMWVHPDHIGSGIGRKLFRHALATTRARHGKVLKIAADPNAEAFYVALGACRVGEVRSKPRGRKLPLLAVHLSLSAGRSGLRRTPSMRPERSVR